MPARWDGVLITRRYKRRAVQTRTPWDLADVGRVDEDSLYLNIVGPANYNEKYPVNFNIRSLKRIRY
jgi:carboxylesterase type B